MSQPAPKPHRKLPGWIGAAAVVVLVGGGWLLWSQLSGGGPRVGEKIALAPESEARARGQQLGREVQRALSNLGRDHARPATRPTTAPATTPAR